MLIILREFTVEEEINLINLEVIYFKNFNLNNFNNNLIFFFIYIIYGLRN